MSKDYSKYFIKSNNTIVRNIFNIPAQLLKLGQNRSFFVKTYGCQSNLRDAEDISGILKLLGFLPTNNIEMSDLIILNTCAIRENAEKKVYGEIGFLKKLKRKNPKLLLGICGCMPQTKNNILKMQQIDHIDFVFGTHNIHMLPEILQNVITEKKRIVHVLSKEEQIIENTPINRSSPIKAFVNIMYGCDKFCSYCIVPYTRGRIRSRDKEDILREINDLLKSGYQEITLLGQNVNAYGIDKKNDYFFWNLLEDVAKTKIQRIRFVTSNPWNFDIEIIKVMRRYTNIMPYVHLPIQSGDEQILKAMNRQMLINDYIKIIKMLRKSLPSVAISTDIIVGFPNETTKQFHNTLDLYRKIKFDNAYTFIFSPRNGTAASLIKDKTNLIVKKRRLSQLNELVKKYAKWNNEKYVGKVVKVLVEGSSKTKKDILTGYSPEWKIVNFKGYSKTGTIADIKITSASRFSLNGIQI